VNLLDGCTQASLAPGEGLIYAKAKERTLLHSPTEPLIFLLTWNGLNVDYAVRFAKALEASHQSLADPLLRETLRYIDTDFEKLVASNLIDEANEACRRGNGQALFGVLCRAYGELREIICLDQHDSILVFNDGTGVLAGYHATISILTFGYSGTGPRNLTSFLTAAGFDHVDATAFTPWSIVRKDGHRVDGCRENSSVVWSDGTRILIPRFPRNRK